MKKHIIVLALALVVLMVGCSKEKRCKCTSVGLNHLDKHDITYIKTDAGFSCSKITHMGFERLNDGSYERQIVEVTCEEVKN